MFIILGADGKEYGPATATQVRLWMHDGRADRATKARRATAAEWLTLADFPEICPPPAAPPPQFEEVSAEPAEPAPFPVTAPPVVLADRWVRLGARLIDFTISLFCLSPGAYLVGWDVLWSLARGQAPEPAVLEQVAGGMLVLFAGVLLPFLVQVWLLTTRGQTLGKMFTRIRIVRADTGERPGFMHAVLLRDWIFVLLALVPFLGNFISLVDACFIFRADQRCLHDLVAGTIVVENP